MEFRTLRPDEIEIRVARARANGAQFLLYKDARCDMAILDETVGEFGWQREHREHKGNLFCAVGIYSESKDAWIWKEDAGSESNTEAEKGHASDSFKRACVNWGIGRELYTAPFIWISGCTEKNDRGAYVPKDEYMNLSVSSITYDEKRRIDGLTIVDKNGKEVYSKTTAPTKFICAKCGKTLKPYSGKDGKEIPIRRHATKSMDKFGEIRCIDCINASNGN